MADTTALKNRIRAAIKSNDNQEITGPVLQQALLDMVDELNGATETEANARQSGDSNLADTINNLRQNITAEVTARQQGDTQLNNLITGIKNNIDNGYVYAGIAIPSTTPASGKVFYLALTAGTYTNFGATVVPQGINILKYNGSSWSLDSFLGLDDTPTEGSNNLVKSGSVLDSIIKDGSAFDLSAYNSSATYADLSAALTALNALPAAYKKGGMSMKFVQSSDNNYVQFKCKTQSFSTNPEDWDILDGGVYVENPEFVEVHMDAEGKILWAIKIDGGTYFGAGCPQQVKDYVNEKLYTKVDKEENKSLIDAEYASSQSTMENPEFLEVTTDSEGKIVEGINKDGRKEFYILIDKLPLTEKCKAELIEALGFSITPYIGEPDSTDHFTVEVNADYDNNNGETTSLQDNSTIELDQCAISLPHNYSKTGDAVPLVVFCHGAVGYDGTSSTGAVTSEHSTIEGNTVLRYLCANGYAILEANGMPEQFCLDNNLELCDNMGTPMAIQCYIKAYEYAIKNYNVKKDGVVLYGGSMGGIVSTNLLLTGAIPVKVQVASCPCLDIYNQGWLHPWYSPTNHNVLGVNYGFEKEHGVYVYDETKVRGFNPIVNSMQSYNEDGVRVSSVGTYDFSTHTLNGESVTEYKNYPVVLKIWHSVDDPTVNYAVSERQVKAINNAGGMAYLRLLPSGGHSPMAVGTPISNPTGNAVYRGTTLSIYPPVEELYLFVKRYC